MEYRLWVTVPDLPVSDEENWGPLIGLLEALDYGAVIGWNEDAADLVLSLEADSEAHAAREIIDAVTEALHATGLGDRYPTEIEIEPVVSDELAPA